MLKNFGKRLNYTKNQMLDVVSRTSGAQVQSPSGEGRIFSGFVAFYKRLKTFIEFLNWFCIIQSSSEIFYRFKKKFLLLLNRISEPLLYLHYQA